MSDDAETIAQLQAERAELLLRIDATVADAAAVCERMAQGHDRIAAASSPAPSITPTATSGSFIGR